MGQIAHARKDRRLPQLACLQLLRWPLDGEAAMSGALSEARNNDGCAMRTCVFLDNPTSRYDGEEGSKYSYCRDWS